MSEYLLSVIGMVLFCSVLSMIIPQGKTSTIVQAIGRLACILAILSPLAGYFIDDSKGIFSQSGIEVDETFIKYYSEMRIEEAEERLERQLKEEYGEALVLTLYWGWEDDNRLKVYQTFICASLSPTDKEKINKQVHESLGVEVVYVE